VEVVGVPPIFSYPTFCKGVCKKPLGDGSAWLFVKERCKERIVVVFNTTRPLNEPSK